MENKKTEIFKYLKCSKCGNKIKTSSDAKIMCMKYAWYRISNICGGCYDIEITEKEYNKD